MSVSVRTAVLLLLLLLLLSVVVSADAGGSLDRIRRLRPKTTIGRQLREVEALLGRVLPEHKGQLKFLPLKRGRGGRDAFEVKGRTIRATSGVAAASGLRYYLQTVCKASIHWGRQRSGFNVDHLPAELPRAPRTIRRSTGHTLRYYFNAVTYGYSSAWWDWQRWQEELDWAALHGINFFLAIEGQEYIWEKLWREMGVSEEDLERYFPGPAFLAWHRMGNLDGFMGPQPKGWRENRRQLQKKIVERMRGLGMVPVLTAFAGHIPQALEKVRAEAGRPIKVHRGASKRHGWCGFEPTTLLDASDPLFREIGRRFLELQKEEYGSDSVYACDTFNEMQVPFTDAESLRQSSAAVIEGMQEADPDAVWLMQGWLFLFSRFWWPERIHAYLSGVPNDRMVVLDLFAEKRSMWDETESFFGKPFIWCQLLNFGGNHGLFGNMTRVAVEPARALRETPLFFGTGMSMEAIERNPVLFSLVADTAWSDDPIPITPWLTTYLESRYQLPGPAADSVLPAFLMLNRSVYSWNGQLIKPPLEERPRYFLGGSFRPPLHARYQPHDVTTALRVLLRAAQKQSVPVKGPFQQDLVDVGRQVLVDIFTDLVVFRETLLAITGGSETDDEKDKRHVEQVMLELMDDLDRYLATDVNFMLGPVLEEATKPFGAETEEQVRNILTLWGDGIVLNDYAAKQYSPMVKQYYRRRWELYFEGWQQTPPSLGKMLKFENEWFKQQHPTPTEPQGESLTVALELLNKYAMPPTGEYEVWEDHMPSAEAEFHQAWTQDPGVLRFLCELTPKCGGFTGGGLLIMGGSDSSVLVAQAGQKVFLRPRRPGQRLMRLRASASPVFLARQHRRALAPADELLSFAEDSAFPREGVILPTHPPLGGGGVVSPTAGGEALLAIFVLFGWAACLWATLRFCCASCARRRTDKIK